MSKDMLGSVVRAAVGVPQERLDLLAKIASSFADDNPSGEAWHTHLGTTVKNGLPKAKQPTLEPTIIELGEFEVNYDEAIGTKLASVKEPACIGWRTDWATDDRYPDPWKGKKRYRASAVCFKQSMKQETVETWCKDNKKILALPKDGIDIAKVSPRPKLDNVMPLAMAGQFFVDADGNRRALVFRRGGGGRDLGSGWLYPGQRWGVRWWFLVLEELHSSA